MRKSLLMRFCGYRKYSFKLFTGQRVSFWATGRGEADQKALNLEHRIKANMEKARVNREQIIRTLQDGEPIGRQELTVSEELTRDVLAG